MKDVLHKNRVFIFGAAALVLLAAVFLFLPHRAVPHFSPLEYAKAKTFWNAEIHDRGAASAYKEFVSSGAGEDADSAHITAHAMGAALFEQLGDGGLSHCDASFGFGCYHGFFLAALGTEGESRVSALYDVCVKVYGVLGTGCQHGIGHGIMEYVGYDNVPRALELCSTLAPQPAPLLGCTSGVFMEYFWPLGKESLPSARPVDAMNPYAPCPEVSGTFRPSCYFELGNRYAEIPGTDYNALCGGLSGDPRRYCFEGAGYGTTSGHFSPAPLTECDASPQPEDVVNCRAGAAWSRFSQGHSESVRAACADPVVTREQECLSHADFTDGKDPTFPKPYDEN